MTHWPKHPIIYEINTWVWLQDLSQRHSHTLTLANVPMKEWDSISELGVDAVWFMGVWERSPFGTRIAREDEGLQAEYRRALPDFSAGDVVGSPYCVHRYVVDENLGGPEGLAFAREALSERNIHLILDFIPNHIAPDHPWVIEHPEYLIQGNADDLTRAPDEFFELNGNILAHGRDPFFPPWRDTVQINAFHSGLREAVIRILHSIADNCDGVRCDMAMLMMNRIFKQTWGQLAGNPPDLEFWSQVINTLRETHPDFLFIAEAYWDLEWELQQQGFDYCYDKRLYDRIFHGNAETVRLHLMADLSYQERLIRFIENHDEPRASVFGPLRSRAAALIIATLPGAKLFHEGQFEGRKIRLPVQLGRRPSEDIDLDLLAFYRTLLKTINALVFRYGEWKLCARIGWPDNSSYINLVAWCWHKDEERWLVVVNLSDNNVQGRILLPWDSLEGQTWQLIEAFSSEVYRRDGDEMHNYGLYVSLGAWGFHFLRCVKE